MKETDSSKPSVLVVDDDKNTRDGLARALASKYEVLLAEGGEKALGILRGRRVDILLTDVRMPGMDGLTLLQRTMALDDAPACVLLTAYGNVEVAVEAMKRGAHDFLTKPLNLDHLDLVLQRVQRSQAMESENVNLHAQLDAKYGMENIVGTSPVMRRLYETIQQAAPTQATVLIEGESGTGKELVAHAVHRLSTRSKGPFIAVHCAALSPTLLESELFGHEKGAFTGADARRRGRFEMADGGTLFLDEVSEIDASVQVKLLRVLEERQFERVGGNSPVEVDIRLIAATNSQLRERVDAGEFREDLFFRLDVVNVTLPPLRDRRQDVPLLCEHFLREFSRLNNKPLDGITQEALRLLTAYAWPGNVRELRNTIEKMVVLSKGKRLAARDVPGNIRAEVQSDDGSMMADAIADAGGVESLADAEKALIYAALKKHNNNRTRAAEEIGISRRTLHRKLKRYRGEQAEGENE